jgi:hypothetical protein
VSRGRSSSRPPTGRSRVLRLPRPQIRSGCARSARRGCAPVEPVDDALRDTMSAHVPSFRALVRCRTVASLPG